MAPKQPGFTSARLPCLGEDAGEVQMSESTTEEHLVTEDCITEDKR